MRNAAVFLIPGGETHTVDFLVTQRQRPLQWDQHHLLVLGPKEQVHFLCFFLPLHHVKPSSKYFVLEASIVFLRWCLSKPGEIWPFLFLFPAV